VAPVSVGVSRVIPGRGRSGPSGTGHIAKGLVMDIICPNCCEPWEIDTLHEYAQEAAEMFPKLGVTFETVRARFMSQGCGSAFDGWKVTCEPVTKGLGLSFYALGELFGDDVDGYAVFCDDFGGDI